MSEVSNSQLLPLSDEMVRLQSSQPSMVSSSDDDFEDICRICHSEGQTDSPLISPCCCSGSLCYVHNSCLQEWIRSSDIKCCEICKFQFIMHTKFMPFWKWKKFTMTLVEKLLLVFFITFHATMLPIMVYLRVLLAESEVSDQTLLLTSVRTVHWFLNLIIDFVLFMEVVFVIYQCYLCVLLFRKWRNCNRVIYVQDAPKTGGTIQQQQQQQPVAFSASSQLLTNELTSEDTNWFSPKESKFYNCQSDSNINIRSSNSCSVKVCDEKNTSGEITKTKTSSTETSLTFDYNLPLSEVVVISTAADDNSKNDSPKNVADKIHTTEVDSREISLIAATDNAPVSVANHKCPHSDSMVSSTEPVKGKLKKIYCYFFPGSHSNEHAEDKDFLPTQVGHS